MNSIIYWECIVYFCPTKRPDFAICLARKEHPGLGLLAGEPFIKAYTQQSLGELAGDSAVQELSWG